MAVYPPRMAPFGLQLWESAIQLIPEVSFFDTEENKLANFFNKSVRQKRIGKLPVFEELWIFGRNRQMCLENFDVQLSATFGRGVKVVHAILVMTFGQK